MFSITSYFSCTYFVLLLSAILFYAFFPRKPRRWILLIFNYAFFFAVSGKLVCYLMISTLSVHHIGLWLAAAGSSGSLPEGEKKDSFNRGRKTNRKPLRIMIFAVIFHIGLLVVLKYTPFIIENLNSVIKWLGLGVTIQISPFLVPIGISFYTLQAVSYLFDVYRKKIDADKNLMRLALYMSFFPQIMEGPICRYSDTAALLWQADKIQFSNFLAGLQRILFGVMKKIVIADRLNLLIKNVFLHYNDYDGLIIALGVVCYTLQLYMEFSGTMDVVIGSAQIFGIRLPENFKRPFFSASISEFWKRWHITLGTWFKDYVFFPVSMTGPMKKLTMRARKKVGNQYGMILTGGIALFCVWLGNGLWHGAGWNYLFFGMYHFVLILCGSIVEPVVIKITGKLRISRTKLPYRSMRIIRTALLVCIGELFFRASGLEKGFTMLGKIFTDFSFSAISDGSLFTLGMDQLDYCVILGSVVLLFIIGLIQEKAGSVREIIGKRIPAVRFVIYYALIMAIVVFGAYGTGYVPVDPIYAGF